MNPEKFLSLFDSVTESGEQFLVRCPAHDDTNDSLAVRFTPEGKILLHCHAGCPTPEVVDALGMSMGDLVYPLSIPARVGAHLHTPTQQTEITIESVVQPQCTVVQYAQLKQLPEEFLRNLGLSDHSHRGIGRTVVRIPYMNGGGTEVAARYRVALEGDRRFMWRSGDKPLLYGIWRLGNGKVPDSVVLCEGESDCHTLWYHGYEALGVPGANSWNEERDAGYFADIGTVYVIDEGDHGARSMKKWISESSIRDRVRFVDLGPYKDPSQLHIAGSAQFKERFESCLAASTPFHYLQDEQHTLLLQESLSRCQELSRQKDILSVFAEHLPDLGFAGDPGPAKLIYLALTTRILSRPTSIAVDGPSSAGKSFLVDTVLRFMPEDVYHEFSGMSEKNLAYTDRDLRHRFIVLYEASGLSGDFQSYLIRSLLSEGRIRYEFVEKTSEGLQSRTIEKEGPTGLILTTTAVQLHPENETRFFMVTLNDSEEHTHAILRTLAKEEPDSVDFTTWHALQTYIQHAKLKVRIPYAEKLAELTRPIAIRLRRDFSALLSLIRAHAVLHFQTRDRTEDGAVIASLEDYQAARDLINPLVSFSVEATVPDTIRQTVEAVKELLSREEDATVKLVANALNIDRSAAQRRIKSAIRREYLNDLDQGKRGCAHRYTLAGQLPDDVAVFPDPDALAGRTSHTLAQPTCTPEDPANSDTNAEVCRCAVHTEGIKRRKLYDTVPDLTGHTKLFVDTETTGLDPHSDRLVLVQIHAGDHTVIMDARKADLTPLKPILEDKSVLKVLHNAAFDIKFLKKNLGCNVVGIFDTFLAERLITAGTGTLRDCSLRNVAKKYLDKNVDKSQQVSFAENCEIGPEQLEYAAVDVEVLPGIFEAQKSQLTQQGLVDTARLEFDLSPVIAGIELKGVAIDTDRLGALRQALSERITELEGDLGKYASINYRSASQVIGALHELGFDVPSTKRTVLESIDHPFAALMLEYREASKLASSFAEKLPTHISPATGRIHPSFMQIGTDTGRMSCRKPNLQQIPKQQQWRDLFVAPPGYELITADYSQIELRILAEFSQDEAYIKAFNAGDDFHQRTADLIGIDRGAAKAINFGLVYGMSAGALSKRIDVTLTESERFIRRYFAAFPKVRRCLEDFAAKPIVDGYTATPLGRKRFFRGAGTLREHGELKRKGRNTPIQSTCGDILKQAVLDMVGAFAGHDAHIVNLVHDEVVVECKAVQADEVARIIRSSMTAAASEVLKSVPVEVDLVIDRVWRK
nr:hypothetical protein 14 [Desulfobacterales bacterium]